MLDDADVVIVGGGSAGCVLAARLSEDPSVQVALLEAGPPDDSVLIHCPAGLAVMARLTLFGWGLNTVPQPGLNNRRGYQPRGKVLGGSSSLNAMCYVRGHRADYDRWAAMGNRGWSYDDLLPYFKKSEDNTRGAGPFHGVGGPLGVTDLQDPNPWGARFIEASVQAGYSANADFNGPDQEGVGPYQVTHTNGERCSAAKAYLGMARGRPNLRVLTGALTRRVLLEGKRAVGVEFEQSGQVQQVRARQQVVLSAGAIQSPQLLMLSGIGARDALMPHGIALRHELPGVGGNLQDHIDVVQVVHVPGGHDLFGLSLPGAARVLGGIQDWRLHRTGLLTTNFAEAGGFIKSSPDQPLPDLQLHFVVGKLIDHGRKTVWGHGYSCHVCLLRPRSRGTVRLASADPHDLPLVDPAYLSAHEDLADMVRGFKALRNILQQPALVSAGGRELPATAWAHSDDEVAQVIRDRADTIYHPAGTCRMGRGDDAVVDDELRVHGLQSLRVVDASVMPTLVGGNTNAPVMAMAEKAADLIRASQSTLRA